MRSRNKKWQFAAGIAVILTTVVWLSYSGIQESKTYYVTISELLASPDSQQHRLRVAGDVVPGSIERADGRVRFQIVEEAKQLPVVYVGTEPLPDTLFNEGAQAIADGRYQPDGVFHAEAIQAKCPSKYESAASAGSASEAASAPAKSY
jgi:cytochrome c-type biogenesis protein CcmE